MLGPVADDGIVTTTGQVPGSRGAGEHGVAAFELMLVALIGVLVLAISMPALLRSSPGTNDTDARANLTNAVISAKAAYSVAQSYSWEDAPLSPLSFDSQDPAFSWTTGSCAGESPNCVSEQVVDVNTPGDSQGVVVAVWSSLTRTCWFATDLESVPEVLSADRSGRAFDAGSGAGRSRLVSGVYYARSEAGISACSADDAIRSPGAIRWGPSLSSAGAIG
jgi:hypothetical protein